MKKNCLIITPLDLNGYTKWTLFDSVMSKISHIKDSDAEKIKKRLNKKDIAIIESKIKQSESEENFELCSKLNKIMYICKNKN